MHRPFVRLLPEQVWWLSLLLTEFFLALLLVSVLLLVLRLARGRLLAPTCGLGRGCRLWLRSWRRRHPLRRHPRFRLFGSRRRYETGRRLRRCCGRSDWSRLPWRRRGGRRNALLRRPRNRRRSHDLRLRGLGFGGALRRRSRCGPSTLFRLSTLLGRLRNGRRSPDLRLRRLWLDGALRWRRRCRLLPGLPSRCDTRCLRRSLRRCDLRRDRRRCGAGAGVGGGTKVGPR